MIPDSLAEDMSTLLILKDGELLAWAASYQASPQPHEKALLLSTGLVRLVPKAVFRLMAARTYEEVFDGCVATCRGVNHLPIYIAGAIMQMYHNGDPALANAVLVLGEPVDMLEARRALGLT